MISRAEVNRIYCMDCIKGLAQLPDKSVDVVITDPPFNFDTSGYLRGSGMMKKKTYVKRISESFGASFDPKPFLALLPRIMKIFNGFFFCNKSLVKEYLDFAINNGYNYDILIWNKPNPIPIKNNHFVPDIEYCIYIRDKGACFNNDLPFDYYRKVQTFDSPSQFITKEALHPTIKPIELIRRLIKISSQNNDIILDPYMGSGTTAVACKQLDRNFIGFEINPQYCEVANARLEQEILGGWMNGL